MKEKSTYNGNKENVTKRHQSCFNRWNEDFPGGPAVYNLLANAGPLVWKIPQASVQLGLCTTRPVLCNY